MTTSTAVSPRSAAVDIARGLAVLCVVVLHVVVGLVTAGLLGYDHPAWGVNEVLYMLRMPALALLIGLFVGQGVTRRGARGYLVERVVELAWLYVVWSLILGLIGLVTSSWQNTPTDTSALWQLWIPQDHLWFLPLLAVMTAVLVPLRPWQSPRRAVVGLALALVVSAAAWARNYHVVGAHGLGLLFFAALGAALSLPGLTALLQRPRRLWALVLAASLATFLALQSAGAVPANEGDQGAAPLVVAISIACALAGVVAILAVSRLLADVPVVSTWLAAAGRRTMPIFLIHLLFTAGSRIVLERLGVTDLGAHLVIGTTLGIAGPLVVGTAIDRLGVPGLLALPTRWRDRLRAGHGRPPAPEQATATPARELSPADRRR